MNIEEIFKIFYFDNVRKVFGGCISNVKGEKKWVIIVSLFGLEIVLMRNNCERWR